MVDKKRKWIFVCYIDTAAEDNNSIVSQQLALYTQIHTVLAVAQFLLATTQYASVLWLCLNPFIPSNGNNKGKASLKISL